MTKTCIFIFICLLICKHKNDVLPVATATALRILNIKRSDYITNPN